MRPLIGYNYGAGEHARVRQIFFDSLILISGVMVIGTALCLAIPSSLIGLGKGAPSLVISLMRYIVVIIPAALILTKFFDANGVWHAMWLTEFITAAASCVIYLKFIRK